LIITDIDIINYQSTSNRNHFFQKCIFSVVNTTRYNTISFRSESYQDTTPMIQEWNTDLSKVANSQDIVKKTNTNSTIYISILALLNNTSCVLGQESDCEFNGYSKNNFNNASPLDWLKPNTSINNTYNTRGNYDQDGNIKIVDYGPSNINDLISKMNLKN
jgi:hypothetical protein